MNKLRVFTDRDNVLDKSSIQHHYTGNGIKGTYVEIKDNITGKVLFKGHNKVIIAGSAFTASKHFDIPTAVNLPNYNTALNLDHTVTTDPENAKKVVLFGVGIDGCGPETSQIYDVDYEGWTPPDKLVPFRYVDIAKDITAAERNIYFGRKTTATKIAYYFKVFETDPVMHEQYIDGTPIDESLYESSNKTDAEVYVELKLKVTNTDCRDWFRNTTGMATAKINTITLLTAWKKTIDDKIYYQDIQPLTKLNIQNESLFDETKGLDIIYHIYY